jgi:FtsZ-binding cell division protein ZapB
MNPIMALFDPIERLINEHGSAAILRDHVALFKDQLSVLKEKFMVLAAEKEKTDTEYEELKMQNEALKNENIDLKKKITSYDQPAHGDLLDEIKTKILLLISASQRGLTADDIASVFNANVQTVKYHLEELEKSRMVAAQITINRPSQWLLTQGGRKYLVEHKLIS